MLNFRHFESSKNIYLLDGYILKDTEVPDKASSMSIICESRRREKLPSMVAHICNYNIQGSEVEGSQVASQSSYIVRLILKSEKEIALGESKMIHKGEIHDAILRKIPDSRTDDQKHGRKSRQCYHEKQQEERM